MGSEKPSEEKKWTRIYMLVIAVLVASIVFFYLFTKYFE